MPKRPFYVALAAIILIISAYPASAQDNKPEVIPLIAVTLPATIALHLVGSACLILGLFTTEAALILAAFTLLATERAHGFWRHSGKERLDRSRNALANLGVIGGLLILAVTGSGDLALG